MQQVVLYVDASLSVFAKEDEQSTKIESWIVSGLFFRMLQELMLCQSMEVVSICSAYLLLGYPIKEMASMVDIEQGVQVAGTIKERCLSELGVKQVVIGVATTKFLAKFACSQAHPQYQPIVKIHNNLQFQKLAASAQIMSFKFLPVKVLKKLEAELNVQNVLDLIQIKISQKYLEQLIASCFICEDKQGQYQEEISEVLEVVKSLRSISFQFRKFTKDCFNSNSDNNVKYISAKMNFQLPMYQKKNFVLEQIVKYMLQDLIGRIFCHQIQTENWPYKLNIIILNLEQSIPVYEKSILFPGFQTSTSQNNPISFLFQVQQQILQVMEDEASFEQIVESQTFQIILFCENFKKIQNIDLVVYTNYLKMLNQQWQNDQNDLFISENRGIENTTDNFGRDKGRGRGRGSIENQTVSKNKGRGRGTGVTQQDDFEHNNTVGYNEHSSQYQKNNTLNKKNISQVFCDENATECSNQWLYEDKSSKQSEQNIKEQDGYNVIEQITIQDDNITAYENQKFEQCQIKQELRLERAKNKNIDNNNMKQFDSFQQYENTNEQQGKNVSKKVMIQDDNMLNYETQKMFSEQEENNNSVNINVGLKFSTLLEDVMCQKETIQDVYNAFIQAKKNKSGG